MPTKKPPTLQQQLHRILRPISYGNPASPHYEQVIDPADGLFLDFPHLSDVDILLLRRMRAIAPATDAEIRQAAAAHNQAKFEADTAADAAASNRAAQKAAANTKKRDA